MRIQGGRALSSVFLLLVACSSRPRHEQIAGSAAVAAAVAPSASLSLSEAPAPAESSAPRDSLPADPGAPELQLGLRLDPIISSSSVGDLGGPKRFRVMVSWPLPWHELHIDEQVAEIGFPNTCEAFAADATRPWRVTCTPRYRKPVAEAFTKDGDVVLRVIPERGTPRLVKAPLEKHRFAPLTSEVSSRPAPCDPNVTQTRAMNVTLPSANWLAPYPPATIFYLAVPNNPPFALIDQPGWWQGCKPQRVGEAIAIACANGKHAAQITVEGPSIRFEWQDEEHCAGRILLPCDAHAVLATPNFSEGYRYR